VRRSVTLATLAALAACTPQPPPATPEPAPAPIPIAAPAPTPAPEPSTPPCDPTPPAGLAPDDPDPDDPDTKVRRERARRKLPRALAARLQAALPNHRPACDVSLTGPCAARADLDGDARLDDVILVRSDRGEGGLAILWASGGAAVLGAGQRCQQWTLEELPNLDGSPNPPPSLEEIPANLDWLRRWDIYPRRLEAGAPVLVAPNGKRRVTAATAVGDALLLDGGDAAVLVHRSADGWTQLHLGF